MTVKLQRKIEFKNRCGCIVDEDLLRNAMVWQAGRPQCSKKSIYMHGRYPVVSVFKDKIHIHRLLMRYINRDVSIAHLVCHHKDGDRFNALIENLELMEKSKHAILHNSGKTLSKSHKAKIAEAGKLRVGMRMKKRVLIKMQELKHMLESGKSINACAKYFNCDWSTIKTRINENPELLNT